MSSRDDIDIKLHLDSSKNISVGVENNSDDIARFVQLEVDRLISKRLLLNGKVPQKLKCKTVETLTHGAQGMFRWVEMSLETLKRIKFLPDFKKTLGQLPSELSSLYNVIHAQIDQSETYGRDVAIQTLKWLLCAQRLLSAEELIAAVYKVDGDISSDSDEGSETESELLLLPENHILQLCRNLVIFDSEKRLFRFAHQTVREYLLMQPQYTDLEQHTLATERCLDVYLNKWLESSIARKMESQNNILKPYAAVYWPVHYKHVEDSKPSEYEVEKLRFTRGPYGRSLPYEQWILGMLKPHPEAYRSVSYKFAEDTKLGELEAKVSRFTGRSQGLSIPYIQWISELRSICGSCKDAWGDAWVLNRKLGLDDDDALGSRILFAASGPDTLLAVACAFGIPSFLQDHGLLRRKSHVLLRFSAGEGHDKVVQQLLNKGAEINPPDKFSDSALQVACRMGHDRIIQLLLNKGADANARKRCPLNGASRGGHDRIVQMLLDQGADINAQNCHALVEASREGNDQVVKTLLDRGADVNPRSRNALDVASMQGHDRIVQMLLHQGADVNAKSCYALNEAFREGHVRVVKTLLDRGANVNTRGNDGETALHFASSEGHDEIVQMLLDRGADINAFHGEYGTPLRAASYYGYDQIVQKLLNEGADVNAFGGMHGTPLQAAVHGGQVEIVQKLLDRGANINAPCNKYRDALEAASSYGYDHIVYMLCGRGARPWDD